LDSDLDLLALLHILQQSLSKELLDLHVLSLDLLLLLLLLFVVILIIIVIIVVLSLRLLLGNGLADLAGTLDKLDDDIAAIRRRGEFRDPTSGNSGLCRQDRLELLATVGIASLAFAVAPALAEEIKYTAVLTAADETPPTDSTGTGTVDATYDTDTKTLTWTIEYKDLTGPVTAAHFHGPAPAGEKADPVVPVAAPYDSPISGSATLTDEQYADLVKELWYFNLHTDKYPDGELRGQVNPVRP